MPLDPDVEAQYYTSRNFDSGHARDVREHYLQYVQGREFLVELGCGRGEFLGLAKDVVGQVRGVDVDPQMVSSASAAGLDVVTADVRDYLATTTDRPDAVFAAHLVEHLSVDTTYELLQSIGRILRPGGVVVLVTPNPACLAMLTADFWSDPTHVRLYTLELLDFLLTASGFAVVARGGNPADVPGPPPQLLAADTLEPWGPLTESLGSWTIPGEEKKDDLSKLSREVAALRHVLSALDERVFNLRHFAQHIGDRFNDALHFLYPANEIYVVGQKSA